MCLHLPLRGKLAEHFWRATRVYILPLAKKLMPQFKSLRQSRGYLTLLQQEIRV